jgi:hypothetical protein
MITPGKRAGIRRRGGFGGRGIAICWRFIRFIGGSCGS